MSVLVSSVCARFRGSSTVASPALATSDEIGSAVLAEAKQAFGEIVSEAQSSLLTKMDILRQ